MDEFDYDAAALHDPDQIISRHLSAYGRIPGLTRKRKPKFAPPSTPAELAQEKDLLKSVMDSGVGGLQYVGETLDKPGRAVRGLLAGKPQEALNLIPFSDAMGLTKPSDSVSGRDLLEQYGVLDKNTPGLDEGDVLGFGAEMLLDPTSYLTFGASAVGKAGKLAKAAGVSLKGAKRLKTLGEVVQESPHLMPALKEAASAQGVDLASMMGEKLGGAMGFTTGPLGLLGAKGSHVPQFAQGERAAALLGGLDRFTDAASKAPGVRHLRGMFDWRVQGQMDPAGQAMAESATAARKAAEPAAVNEYMNKLDEMAQLTQDLHTAHSQHLTPDQAREVVGRAVQHAGETRAATSGSVPMMVTNAMKKQLADLGHTPEAIRNMTPQQAWDAINGGKQAVPPQVRDIISEVAPGLLPEGTQVDPSLNERVAKMGQGLSDVQKDFLKRAESMGMDVKQLQESQDFQHLARNTLGKNKLKGFAARSEARRYLPAEHFEAMLHDPALMFDSAQMAGGAATKTPEHILVQRLMGGTYGPMIEQAAVASGQNVNKVAREVAGDLYEKGTEYITKNKRFYNDTPVKNHFDYMQGMNRKLANADAVHNALASNLTDSAAGTIPLSQALQDAGFNTKQGMEHIASRLGVTATDLAQKRVPETVARDAASFLTKTTKPQWLDTIGQFVDKITKPVKQNLTLPFASFASRNFVSGQVMNAMSNEIGSIGDLAKYFRHVEEARTLLKNPSAEKKFINELSAHGVFDVHNLESNGVEIPEMNMGWGFRSTPNPITPAGMLENLRGGVKAADDIAFGAEGLGAKLPNPVKQVRKAAAIPSQVGAQLNAQVEWMNRVPMYLYLRKSMGWTPEAAAKRVRQLQVAYEELAPLERDVMKRLAPFYCVPDDTKALTRDGWKTCDEIQVGDELLTYNCDTDRMEWKPCLERAIFEFDGNLSVMANSRHKIRCTDNHRWAVQLQKSGGGFGHSRMLETKDLCLNGRIVVAAPLTAAEDSILTPEQARLLGWLVTDGYWRNRGKHTEAVVYQHPNKFLQEVTAVAGGRPRSPHPDTGVVCVPVLKERVYEIRKYLDKSKLVSVVTRLSRQAAEAMYDAMYKGDGTVATRTSDFLAAQNDGVREAFRVLCAMLGRRSSVNYCKGKPRGVVTSRKQHLSLHALRKWEEKYTGRVWCPRTENGTWVMQQGGLITITGNTYSRKVIPEMFSQMAQRPGGVTAQLVRASNTGRSDGDFVPPYVGEGMSVNLGGDKYLSQVGLPTDLLSDMFVKGPTALGTVKRTSQKALSMLNPYVKGPLEVATGQNFFTGRPIEESFKYPTDNVLLNQVLHNSPASRAITTGRKLLDDDRKSKTVKALNALTGLQINDVSGGIEGQQRFAESKMLAEMLREHPGIGTVTDVYQKTDPKTGKPMEINQDTIKLLRAYGHLKRLSAEENKKRKKQRLAGDL